MPKDRHNYKRDDRTPARDEDVSTEQTKREQKRRQHADFGISTPDPQVQPSNRSAKIFAPDEKNIELSSSNSDSDSSEDVEFDRARPI